jgi:hypothetical protein
MNSRRALFWSGLIVLMAGGALLAFGSPQLGTVLGTTMGLAGAGLIAWAWAGGRGGSDH